MKTCTCILRDSEAEVMGWSRDFTIMIIMHFQHELERKNVDLS